MNFDELYLNTFNVLYGTNILTSDSFETICSKIELAGNIIFYISLNESDVLEAVKEELEFCAQINLELIKLPEVGVFMGLQN